MGKTVVILADTDERYIMPLELKFVEELGDKVELEVITKIDYFDDYFSEPRKADILVVSEELYSIELERHDIANIFVLSEQKDEGYTSSLAITRIYKYTSIKEIYRQVMARSTELVNINTLQDKQTKVVLVFSASGGVGKTTLALGISRCLSSDLKKVLYIDAERINNFQYYLNNKVSLPKSIYSEMHDNDECIFQNIQYVIRNEKFDYLPPFSVSLSSINEDVSVYERIIKSAKKSSHYDVIVVDTDNIFDENKAALISLADKVLMVITQTKESIYAMNILRRNMNCNDDEKFNFICNKFTETQKNSLVEPDVDMDFRVNEYIREFDKTVEMSINDIGKLSDIKKISLLVM